jgi:hypothetical protein
VFTRRPALSRQLFGGIVCQNPPLASRLPNSSAAPFVRSAHFVFSVRPVLDGPSSAVSSDLLGKSFSPVLSAVPRDVQMRSGHPGWGYGTFQRSDLRTIRVAHYSLSAFIPCICELFSPVAKFKFFLFSTIQTLFAKHRGWVSDRVTDVLTFRRSDVQTLHVSPLHSVLTHFSASNPFRIRSYANTTGVCHPPQINLSRIKSFQSGFAGTPAHVPTLRPFDVRTMRSLKERHATF